MERAPRSSRRPHAWQSVTNMDLSSAARVPSAQSTFWGDTISRANTVSSCRAPVLGHPPAGRAARGGRHRHLQRRGAAAGLHPVGGQPAGRQPGAGRRGAAARAAGRPAPGAAHPGRRVAGRARPRRGGPAARGPGRHRRPAAPASAGRCGSAPCRASAPRCCRGCSAGSARSGPASSWSPLETFDHAELARASSPAGSTCRSRRCRCVEGPFAVRRILDDPFVLLAPADAPQAGSDVGDAAAGRPAAADRVRRPGPAGRAGPAPAADRARPDVRLPVQRQPDRCRASSPPASATP